MSAPTPPTSLSSSSKSLPQPVSAPSEFKSKERNAPKKSEEEEDDGLGVVETPEFKKLLAEKGDALPKDPSAVEAFLESMPLVATATPESHPPEVKNQLERGHFDALDSIADEHPGDERAENFKGSGNEAFKIAVATQKILSDEKAKSPEERDDEKIQKFSEAVNKRLEDAMAYYQQGLECNPKNQWIKSQLHSNRAQIEILRENFGRAIAECDAAISADANNSKAFFRAATALCKLEKYDKAKEYAEKGAKCKYNVKAEHKAFAKLSDEIQNFIRIREEKLKKAEEERERKRLEEEKRLDVLSSEKKRISQAIRNRGLTMGKSALQMDEKTEGDSAETALWKKKHSLMNYGGMSLSLYDSQCTLHEDHTLSWPILILYPLSLQSDFIQKAHENTPLIGLLREMFPPTGQKPPWDSLDEYTLDNISVFIDIDIQQISSESVKEKLLSDSKFHVTDEGKYRCLVNSEQTISQILSSQNLNKRGFVIPGIPTFIILPNKRKNQK